MIIATAGHVDHGKTSLVKQLTGVDTDRLEEEKRRGLSINLGFAYQQPEPDVSLGFIDVPGHRRFINTMIAGISGIDLGMLVVAADDGPMPQTREHRDVLDLLGIEDYFLVITKIDRVEAQRVAAVQAETQNMLPDDTPVFHVSNQDGTGIDALKQALYQRAREKQQRSGSGHFRLSLDRAFNLKGSGLVVTGTALAGQVKVGDKLTALPHGKTVRVRSLHAQDQARDYAHAGERVALNIAGDISKADLQRGDWLVAEEVAQTSERFDARISLLADLPFPVKHLSPVRLHLGAKRVPAKLFLLEDAARLGAGDTTLVQLICDSPVHCCHGDRFILRDDSESTTLGGGRVLDPTAPRAGKQKPERIAYLRALELDTLEQSILDWTDTHNRELNFARFCTDNNLRAEESEALLAHSALENLVRLDSEDGVVLMSEQARQKAESAVLSAISQYHESQPEEPGISPPALRRKLKHAVSGSAYLPLLKQMLVKQRIGLSGGMLHQPQRKPALSEADLSGWQAVDDAMEKRAHLLPLMSDLLAETGLAQPELQGVIQRAVKARKLVRLNPQRYARPQDLIFPSQCAATLAASDEGLTVIRYKQALDCGRKLAIDILEYFDSVHFTQRRDQVRVIHDATVPNKLFSH